MSAPRRAFSVIELLVVVAIVAVLSALVLGGVAKARDAVGRTACGNHLRQLGVALHGYHDAHGGLPPGMVCPPWASW
jgi:prepilin-type N-terminal cleavage/methylation domain-containing protein